jgi:ABC-type nitrate/sulfonate/bicarbonate transport system substrate-binding protein
LKKKETHSLRVGFVPLKDSAPLIIARELGLFAKHGLKVELKRELGWATIRDKIIYGELDAAHALAGMPFAISFGLGSVPCECVTGLVLNLHGNAITLSNTLWENGVRDAASLRELIKKSSPQKNYTFGVVFPFSSHNFLLRQWLAKAGIHPDGDVRIVVVPPPQMVVNLKAGTLDGYCVGEPWNSVAAHNRIGWCVATSSQLAPGHPEKVLLVRRDFAEKRAPEHLAMIAALVEACAYCDRAENAGEVMNILARREYLNISRNLLEPRLGDRLASGPDKIKALNGFQIFHRHKANEPSQQKAGWVIQSILQSGLVPDRTKFPMGRALRIFRPDIFAEAQQLIHPLKSNETSLTHA